MGVHTVIEAEAKEQLSELIQRAFDGDAVRITSADGRVVELKAAAAEPDLPHDIRDVAWLQRNSIGRIHPTLDGAQLVRRMRDAGW